MFRLVASVAVSLVLASLASVASAAPHGEAHAPVANRAPLEPTPFVRLPIGSVQPRGWLRRQLDLQKSGLTGAAEQLYDALQPDSAWLGGDGESWERGPYYVKGLVALAHTLDDDQLEQRAAKWVDWTLASQRDDGFFGPASNDDWWPRMVVLYYLRDHYEATGDQRVVPFLVKYFRHQLAELPKRPLRDWGRARAGDNMDVVLWTYNLTGEAFLLELAQLLYDQAYPWSAIYSDNRFYEFGDDFHPHHIVNVSQALRMPAVAWQVTHDDHDRQAFQAGVVNLERHYGRVDGQVSGAEMLSGRSSTDGVELCADVERILSNGIAATILGDPALGDQMEKVAFNSLPAHTSAQCRQITYYQLPNQVAATHGGHGFTQDYANANMPGPHSGFPCCCYNWHFGWPKFVQHMWAATADGGLAAMAYGPNRVTASVRAGTAVTITQRTEYPFRELIALEVSPEADIEFPLVLRIPGWCLEPRVSVNGRLQQGVLPGAFFRIERTWQPGDRVELQFPMPVRTSAWINDSVALERGPLAFSLRMDEDWQVAHEYPGEFNEFEIRPRSPWNYALQIDRDRPAVDVEVRSTADVPFASGAAPVVLRAPARRLPGWGMRTQLGSITLGRADGSWHPIQHTRVSLEPNQPHRLKVSCKGKKLRVFVDGVQQAVIERDDDAYDSGAIGLRSYQAAAKFDDVRLNGKIIDDFQDGNAKGWTTYGGEWHVRDGQFVTSPKRAARALFDNVPTSGDFVVEATVTAEAGGDAGIVFRASEPTDDLDGYQGYYVGLSCVRSVGEDAAEPPQSPVASNEPLKTIELIPFGSTKIRVTYFPVLRDQPATEDE